MLIGITTLVSLFIAKLVAVMLIYGQLWPNTLYFNFTEKSMQILMISLGLMFATIMTTITLYFIVCNIHSKNRFKIAVTACCVSMAFVIAYLVVGLFGVLELSAVAAALKLPLEGVFLGGPPSQAAMESALRFCVTGIVVYGVAALILLVVKLFTIIELLRLRRSVLK
jgi:hypothetical protein